MDSEGFYTSIMDMDWPNLSMEQKYDVTPIVLAFVGKIGRDYVL